MLTLEKEATEVTCTTERSPSLALGSNASVLTSDVKYLCHEDWQAAIDQSINHWIQEPNILTQDEIAPITTASIRSARDLARSLANAGCLAPTWIVPNGDSGIVFEWRSGPNTTIYEVGKGGSVEAFVLRENKMLKHFKF